MIPFKIQVVLVLLLLASCVKKQETTFLPYYNTPDFTPIFIEDKSEIKSKIDHTIAPFSFRNQNSEPISDKTIKGKIHVANFIFTSCGSICPRMTEQMSRIGKAFEKDSTVVILSYSVTPWIDTPNKLKEYKNERGIQKSNWHFLTGSKAAIYDLARKSYFAEESLGFTKDSTEFLHTEHFILVDGSKRIRGIYNGTLQLEAEQLIKDIQTLKQEQLNN